jgi:hypothetical protein
MIFRKIIDIFHLKSSETVPSLLGKVRMGQEDLDGAIY